MTKQGKRWGAKACLAFVLAVACYWPFVNQTIFLDDPFIVEQAQKTLLWAALLPAQSFLSVKNIGRELIRNGMYRPIAAFDLAVDGYFFKGDFAAWKAVNVALHLGNLALLAWCLVLLGFAWRFEWFLLLLVFAAHPVFHHSVLWISFRPDLLGFGLGLAAVCWALHRRGRENQSDRLLMAAGFFAAAFSKETYLVWPLVLMILQPKARKFCSGICAALVGVRGGVWLYQNHILAAATRDTYLNFKNSQGFWDIVPGHLWEFVMAPPLMGRFVYMRVRPLWEYPGYSKVVLVVILVGLLAVAVQSRWRWGRRAVWIYGLFLLPVLGSAAMGGGFLYHFGVWNAYALMLPLALVTADWIDRSTSKLPAVVLTAMLVLSAAANWQVRPFFRDPLVFAEWQYDLTPENFEMVRNHLAIAAYNPGRYEEGVRFYEKALKNPGLDYLKTFNRRGFERSGLSRIHNLAGLLFERLQKYDRAEVCFTRQLDVENFPGFELDARWRLLRLANSTSNAAMIASRRQAFLQAYDRLQSQIDDKTWKPFADEIQAGKLPRI